MNTSSGYDNLPNESPIDDKHKRKDSTRDLNGSYILACRGVESLENSEADYQPKIVSPHVYSHVHHKLTKDCTVYTSIALDDSDDHTGEPKSKHVTTRIINESVADKSLPNPANISDAPLCRICHEGDEEEDLVSPCFCSGTVGALHMSCLEQWLGASDKTRCEICEFQFSIAKRPKPVKWYLKNKALGHERRYMIADIGCAVCFTPLAIGSVTGCLVGAQYFTSVDKDWQATTLILVAMVVLLIFLLWCWFAARRNYIICASWRENFQEIKIKYNPPDKNNNKPTFSRGCSITERMLLESSFPQIPANKISPENREKHGGRTVTYNRSPKYKTTKVQCDDVENLTLKPGTPYPKRKNSSGAKRTSNSHKSIELKELNKKPHASIEQECQHNLRKGHLDAIRSTSTSTPAMVNVKSNKHNIFDVNTCSATPIQYGPFEAMPIHNIHPELVCGNSVLVEDRPGMFVETPYTFNVQTNMAARSMARRGLVFQQAPIATQDSDGLSSTTSPGKNGNK